MQVTLSNTCPTVWKRGVTDGHAGTVREGSIPMPPPPPCRQVEACGGGARRQSLIGSARASSFPASATAASARCRLVCEARVTEDGRRVDSEAGAAAVQIAAREMDRLHGPALIHGAAVLDQLRDLDIWLSHDSAEERVEDWRPSRLLLDLLDADGGYLAPLLG